uniref:Fibronectin type-III domain-containing protein n=1 Tax=Steinernema glaseri TaxID=37863 RepID=A0A1I7ZSV6_9BILA
MFTVHHLVALSAVLYLQPTLGAFTIQPYKQLDYDHYVRLAQCAAKCTEMYGKQTRRSLNDGTSKTVFETHTVDEYKYCERGCQNRRLHFKKHNVRSLAESLERGEQFWNESEVVQKSANSSVIESVLSLCQSVAPVGDEGYGNGIETFVVFKTSKSYEYTPVKYIVQWKHKISKRGYTNENSWITASVESGDLVRVDGLIPGVAYKFRITAVGPKGKLGKVAESEWLNTLPSMEDVAKSGGPMTLRPQYNSEHGVSNLISWPATTGSCHYRAEWSNSTAHLSKQFIVDESRSFLLDHLAFGTEYLVRLTPLSSEDATTVNKDAAVEASFTSIGCNEVFGRGSLECEPEPVSDLNIELGQGGKAKVTWTPSANPEAVLTYQVLYEPLETSPHDCKKNSLTRYVLANATSASIDVDEIIACDYNLTVINYDVNGRAASASMPFYVRPKTRDTTNGFRLSTDSRKLNPIALLVLPGVVLLVLLACCIYAARLRCIHNKHKPGSLINTEVSGPSLV